ncbi:LysM peptidoglycan-binding domain-containing protein [Kribbella deserti]|uniref:LysM peptidoglycan-binding domain-containing protein n=1 Tax=Kribbella deserti TaxID=1926257 RepID=A0ABV6QTD4_9ACTN
MAKSGPQRFPGASVDNFWQSKWGGDPMESRIVVWHTTEGTSLPGYEQGGKAPNFTAVPNFTARKLVWHQHFDFDVSSRALRNLSGGVETNTLHAVQVELVGTCDPKTHAEWKASKIPHLFTPALPDWVLRDLATFARWANVQHQIPLSSNVSWKPFDASFGAGNGVRMTPAKWRTFKGHCGHMHVPENSHGDPGTLPIARILGLAKSPAPPRPAAPRPSVPRPSVPRPPVARPKVHVVRSGETLSGIAKAHRITLAALLTANPSLKPNPNLIRAGQKLRLPA